MVYLNQSVKWHELNQIQPKHWRHLNKNNQDLLRTLKFSCTSLVILRGLQLILAMNTLSLTLSFSLCYTFLDCQVYIASNFRCLILNLGSLTFRLWLSTLFQDVCRLFYNKIKNFSKYLMYYICSNRNALEYFFLILCF
jgi:hypothetical protein